MLNWRVPVQTQEPILTSTSNIPFSVGSYKTILLSNSENNKSPVGGYQWEIVGLQILHETGTRTQLNINNLILGGAGDIVFFIDAVVPSGLVPVMNIFAVGANVVASSISLPRYVVAGYQLTLFGGATAVCYVYVRETKT